MAQIEWMGKGGVLCCVQFCSEFKFKEVLVNLYLSILVLGFTRELNMQANVVLTFTSELMSGQSIETKTVLTLNKYPQMSGIHIIIPAALRHGC